MFAASRRLASPFVRLQKAVTGCICKVLHGTGTGFIVPRKTALWRAWAEHLNDSSDATGFRVGTAAENSLSRVQTSQLVSSPPLYAAQHEADSLARRPAGHLDCHGSRRALDIAALPLGSRRRVRESG